jgi:hypothetical protein
MDPLRLIRDHTIDGRIARYDAFDARGERRARAMRVFVRSVAMRARWRTVQGEERLTTGRRDAQFDARRHARAPER